MEYKGKQLNQDSRMVLDKINEKGSIRQDDLTQDEVEIANELAQMRLIYRDVGHWSKLFVYKRKR